MCCLEGLSLQLLECAWKNIEAGLHCNDSSRTSNEVVLCFVKPANTHREILPFKSLVLVSVVHVWILSVWDGENISHTLSPADVTAADSELTKSSLLLSILCSPLLSSYQISFFCVY